MKRLTDQQLSEATARGLLSGIPLNQCPTCLSLPDEYGDRENGTYRLDGIEYRCNCREQILLRSHYLYANIPSQYHTLDWKDYQGDQRPKEAVNSYLERWPSLKSQGIGLAFLSPKLGVGKTFCSTYIGRELIKRGESVFFLPHNQLTRALRYNEEDIINKLNTVSVAILDDIAAPPHDKLEAIFASNLEDIIRNRTNYNGTTLISSNLIQSELEEHYPRVWSVLEPKIVVVKMDGEDARQTFVSSRNLERSLNGERTPVV